MRLGRPHASIYNIPVRRHQLTQRRRLHIARWPERRSQKINWSAITSLISALTAVGALIFTALSLNAVRDQVSVAEQGQFADRYSRAIEQLDHQGSDRVQIRLGAVYALERLARDSPRDQSSIMETLSTFVRRSVAHTLDPNLSPYKAICPHTSESVAADVQAALRAIGRRDTTQDSNTSINLSRTCLRGTTLNEANLAGVDMTAADLSGVDLSGANLDGAHLYTATLREANLRKANLRGANLVAADLFAANLQETDLTDADLGVADLAGAAFDGARIRKADLGGADLFNSTLTGADLTGANLDGVDVSDAFLSDADLTGANLCGALLSGTQLDGANLDGVIRNKYTRVEHARTDNTTRGKWW
jgi:uncharacterized protein YjbI with pentapeptide repeats